MKHRDRPEATDACGGLTLTAGCAAGTLFTTQNRHGGILLMP